MAESAAAAESVATRVLFECNEAFVYQIPAKSWTSSGMRAITWGLPNPAMRASLHVVDNDFTRIQLRHQDTGKIVAESIFDMSKVPKKTFKSGQDGRTHFVDPVVDSSRYWVLRITGPDGRDKLIGVGVEGREDAQHFRSAVDESVKFMHRAAQAEALSAKAPAASSKFQVEDGASKIKISLKPFGAPRRKRKEKKNPDAATTDSFFAPPPSAPAPSGSPATSGGAVKGDDLDEDDWGDFSSA